jgi:hypothetical protein
MLPKAMLKNPPPLVGGVRGGGKFNQWGFFYILATPICRINLGQDTREGAAALMLIVETGRRANIHRYFRDAPLVLIKKSYVSGRMKPLKDGPKRLSRQAKPDQEDTAHGGART